MRWAIGVLLGLLTLGVVALAIGGSRWAAKTARLVERLETPPPDRAAPDVPPAAPAPGLAAAMATEPFAALPAPVQRYLRTALADAPRPITGVRILHVGEFKANDAPDGWRPFTSEQWVRSDPPGFVWSARVRMLPLLEARVHDAYVGGEGVLEAYLAGLVPVMRAPRSPDLAAGELMRWLAEAAWYPSALLPRPGLTWSAVDAQSAQVTLRDGTTEVTLLVSFGDDGLISRVRAERRMRETPSGPVATPWEGRFWDYQRRDGMLVPAQGEVAWLLPTGPAPYWRGRVTDATYRFAP